MVPLVCVLPAEDGVCGRCHAGGGAGLEPHSCSSAASSSTPCTSLSLIIMGKSGQLVTRQRIKHRSAAGLAPAHCNSRAHLVSHWIYTSLLHWLQPTAVTGQGQMLGKEK